MTATGLMTGELPDCLVIVTLIAYCLGCFTTGYYLVRWKTGVDIRTLGSGNIGARNVGRVLGRNGFLLTSLGDGIKGLLAVGLAMYETRNDGCALVALIAVVMGHIWPVQLGFRGGKGVATSIGGLVIFGWDWVAFLIIFTLGYLILRRTVTSGLLAFLLLPGVSFLLDRNGSLAVGFSLLAVLILICHRQNLSQELAHFRAYPPKSSDTSERKL